MKKLKRFMLMLVLSVKVLKILLGLCLVGIGLKLLGVI